ncbi:diaminopimelate decarboxylase [Cryomorphaceae bacterium]|nr:diaminopimelate decarboxylase [Cryomorphaceae bacterium]
MDSTLRTQLLEAVEQHGSPIYVYDADRMKANYDRFVNAFDVPKLGIYYACKALTNLSILKLFKSFGAGLDCVSLNEVRLGLHAGFAPEDILFTPNNIGEVEYEEAIRLGVRLNVDNLNMLEYIGIHHPGLPLCIRINPHMMAGGNQKISVGHIDSKFGISIHQMPHVERLVNSLDIHVEGIHVHTGSDILDADVFIRAAEILFGVVEKFESVEYIDFGSGFKVAYQPGGLATDIESFGAQFSQAFNAFCERAGRSYTLKFEPGKFFVSDAGYFLVQSNVVKQTTSCVFVGVDSGFNHLQRPMFYDAYHHIENLSRPDGPQKVYTVVGYICESDTFGTDRRISEVQKGDILVMHNAGAYCYSMASNYNSRNRPAEVLIAHGDLHLIRSRETFEDLIRYQKVPEFMR